MEANFRKILEENYKGDEESLQTSLIELKNMGCTQVTSVKLLMNKLSISLEEADKIVLNSKAWENEKDTTLKLRNTFEEGLSEYPIS